MTRGKPVPKFIESNYGSQITVEDGGNREIALALGGMKDVLLSPLNAILLGDWLKKTALEVAKKAEERSEG